MKAIVCRRYGSPDVLRLEEVETPVPREDEVLIAVRAASVNAADCHLMRGEPFIMRLSLGLRGPRYAILGADVAGRVVAVGKNVTRLQPGDEVFGDISDCAFGGFAEYVLADPNYVGHLPAKAGFVEISPILCAGVTVYKGLKVTDTKPDDWVVISGIGGLGHMAVQYAKAMGLNVIAVDVDEPKLDLAKRLGAALAVNARTQDPVAFVKKEVGGAQGVLVTAVSPKAFEQALGMVGRG